MLVLVPASWWWGGSVVDVRGREGGSCRGGGRWCVFVAAEEIFVVVFGDGDGRG